ncbi:methyltransferase [Bacteroidota bacterium]
MDRFQLLVFGILSLIIIYSSRKLLLKPKSHGFYRFLSWECIAFMFAINYPVWFKDVFAWNQIISWIFLIYCVIPLFGGVILMKKKGKSEESRRDDTLFKFEKTSQLIQTGIFKYIRHPLYSSLLFLTWGIYFKDPINLILVFSIVSSIFLYLTAKTEEKENIKYFKDEYREYMRHSKMFIPFIL